jgi:hypothetical protein
MPASCSGGSGGIRSNWFWVLLACSMQAEDDSGLLLIALMVDVCVGTYKLHGTRLRCDW